MLSLEKLRIAVAGVSITYPLREAYPPKRPAPQVAPSQDTMQPTLPSDSFPSAPTFDAVREVEPRVVAQLLSLIDGFAQLNRVIIPTSGPQHPGGWKQISSLRRL